MNPQPARADVELRMMEAMVDCAQALALGFAAAGSAEADLQRRLQLDMAFHRGFTAVRLGIRLCLTLRAGRMPAGFAPATGDAPQTEHPEREACEPVLDPPRREPADRDRERDYEPVSLSRFLAGLRGVASDARREPGLADPGVLPALEDLLARADAPAPPRPKPAAAPAGVALLTRPPPAPPKARLLGSAAPPLMLGGLGRPRPPPRPSG